MIAIDTESSSDHKMICISAAALGKEGTIKTWLCYRENVSWAKEKCEDAEIPKVFANAKYDLQVLRSEGIEVRGEVHDVLLMAKCLYELWPSYSLKNQCYYHLADLYMEDLELDHWFVNHGIKPKQPEMEQLPREMLEKYAHKDAEMTFRLAQFFLGKLKAKGLMGCYDRDRACIRPVWKMERNGVLVDRQWVKDHQSKLKREGIALRIKANNLTKNDTFNLNSIPQIAEYLKADGIALPVTAKGNPSLTKKLAKEISNAVIALRTGVQAISKEANTYCNNLLRASEHSTTVHPNFNISEAATRRFSSGAEFKNAAKLNFQNFPPSIRRAIIVPPGRVGWYLDWTQIENIIHIYFSGDTARRNAYEADPNWSEYLWLAEKILGERITSEDERYKRIKSTKLGMNFGMGAKKYAEYNGLPLQEAFKSFKEIHKACPAIKKLQGEVAQALELYGFVEDVFGYRYHGYPEKAYKVVAYMIQGCAAALMKAAIVEVDKIPGVQLHLTVHDELYCTTADTPLQWVLARRIHKAMTNFSDLFDGIPIRVKVYRSIKNWLERERVKI